MLVTVFTPAPWSAVVHELLVYTVYATLPPAFAVAPASVELSFTVDPASTEVVESVVVRVVAEAVAFTTLHAPRFVLLLASPLYCTVYERPDAGSANDDEVY